MWTPKENFETAEMYFGFEGEKGKKPKIIAYKNPFVIRTSSLKHEWYQDWHEDFHLVKEKCYFKHEYYVAGFQIRTFDKGTYDMYVKFPIICERYKSIRERRQKKVIIKKLKLIVK